MNSTQLARIQYTCIMIPIHLSISTPFWVVCSLDLVHVVPLSVLESTLQIQSTFISNPLNVVGDEARGVSHYARVGC